MNNLTRNYANTQIATSYEKKVVSASIKFVVARGLKTVRSLRKQIVQLSSKATQFEVSFMSSTNMLCTEV